jgi:hypothetical protein
MVAGSMHTDHDSVFGMSPAAHSTSNKIASFYDTKMAVSSADALLHANSTNGLTESCVCAFM